MALVFKKQPLEYYLANNPIVFSLRTDSKSPVEMIFSSFYGNNFKGVYTPTYAGYFEVTIDISDVIQSFIPVVNSIPNNSLTGAVDFSYLDIQVIFKQDIDQLIYYGKVYNGGVSKKMLRYMVAQKKDIFEWKLLNPDKQFLMTTRTSGRHITLRESELCPFYFIASNANYTLVAEDITTGAIPLKITFDLQNLTAGNIHTFDINHIRKNYGKRFSYFKLNVNNNLICDMRLIPSAVVPDIYVIEFRNSYGVPERIEVSGKKTSKPEFSDDNAFNRFDPEVYDFIEQNERLAIREVIAAQFGYKTLEEFLFARDMLQSEKRYLITPSGSRYEVRVKSSEYTHELHPVTPDSVPLEISFVDTETEFSPPPDESLPDGGGVSSGGDFNKDFNNDFNNN